MTLTYAIADLHGRFDLLQAALLQIKQHHSDREPGRIITLGDYIDRGPESRQVIERLMAGVDGGWQLVCLKGNHEDIMVKTLRVPLHPDWWIGNGGGTTLVSYGHEKSGQYRPDVVSAAHVDWVANLPTMIADKHRIYVHAGIDRFVSLNEQDREVLLWKLYDFDDPGGHGDLHVVHGHHQFEDGPVLHSGRTNLDTFAWATGRLVVGVFDDDKAGGPIDLIELSGNPDPRFL